MKKSKVIGFNAAKWGQELKDSIVTENNRKLIEYAMKEIQVLGDMINAYALSNHMDRTGHLLNSLCWVVSYDKETKGKGFYRETVTRSKGRDGSSSSFLHEYFKNDMEEVNGRKLAEEFTNNFKGESHKWIVAFAILAPYWGYWESGHKDIWSGKFKQFQVMTHIYDDVRMDLKPAKTKFTVYVPKYIYKNRKYARQFKHRVGIKKIGLLR